MEFLLSFSYHYRSQGTGIKWGITYSFHYVGDTSDMVQVSVGNKYPADFVLSVLQIFRVRENIIYSRSIIVVELKAHVHDDDVVFVFDKAHVLADFFHSTKRNYADVVSDRRYDVMIFSFHVHWGWSMRERPS